MPPSGWIISSMTNIHCGLYIPKMNTMSTLAFHLTGFKSMNNSLKKIKCLIVEDEPNAQELLQDHIELTPSLNLVGVASNVQEAIQLCIEQKPDLLLLDIQMPR